MGAGGSTTAADSSPPPDAFSSLLTKDFSSGMDRGHIWAVKRDDMLLCGGLTAFLWTWSSVQGPSSSPVIKIATNHMKSIWVVTSDNKLYFRKSHAVAEWNEIKFPGDCAFVSAGGKSVWTIDAEGVVYFRTNVHVHSPSGEDWKKSEGRLSTISVSPSGQAIGINKAGKIFFRRGVTAKCPFGRVWEKISGMANGIAFGENIIWAWNRAGNVFFRFVEDHAKKPEGKKWIKCEGDERMTSISAGSGVCYATDREGVFHRRNGITGLTPQGTDWQSVEEFYFSTLSACAAHSVGLERSCAVLKQEEIAACTNQDSGMACDWLHNSTGAQGQYSYAGAFCGNQVLYTWQMARRVVCLKRVESEDNTTSFSTKIDDDKSKDLSSRLSPKALSALESEDLDVKGNCVRVAGLGPVLCDGESDDPSCHFYVEFASNSMDWRGYLDTSVVYLRNVKTGKYLHIDEHTNLPHCNRTAGGNPCMITVKSNFDKGTVSIHFKHHDSASLSFGVTGDALKVKSIKRQEDNDNVFSSEDESDEISQKLSEEENEKPPPPPTLFVLSVVDDGAKFREKYMTNSSDDEDEDGSVKYLVAV